MKRHGTEECSSACRQGRGCAVRGNDYNWRVIFKATWRGFLWRLLGIDRRKNED